jgi:hypothetical protein
MTKRIPKPVTPQSLLESLNTLITTPGVSDADKIQAIAIAYEIGKGEGRVLGAESMGNTMIASFNKATGGA